MSISCRTGCQLEKEAERNSVYRPTSSASEAGIGGIPSTTRLSPGLISAVCAAARAVRQKTPTESAARILTMASLSASPPNRADDLRAPVADGIERRADLVAFLEVSAFIEMAGP